MALIDHLILPLHPSTSIPFSSSSSSSTKIPKSICSLQNPNSCSQIVPKANPILFSSILSLALTVSLNLNSPLPCLAIPSLNSLSSQPPNRLNTTPYAQSQFLQLGLDNGKIRPCPSINPGCVSTNPKSSSFAFPLTIPETVATDPIQLLKDAIMDTQKNPKFLILEDTPNGRYLQAEVDGGNFSRDVMEFLVKRDVASYRIMATKVTYIYPFTTAFGDSKGQEERMKKIIDHLGWYSPSFESMD